jgi:hypothetical protein
LEDVTMTVNQASSGTSTEEQHADNEFATDTGVDRSPTAPPNSNLQPHLSTGPSAPQDQIRAAIDLGWRVVQLDTELYRLKSKPATNLKAVQRPIALPGRGSLTARRHLLLRSKQLSACLASIERLSGNAGTSLGKAQDYLEPLIQLGATDNNSELDDEERNSIFTTAWRLNEELLIQLQAADSRVGCGYTLGRALCNLSYNLPDCPPPTAPDQPRPPDLTTGDPTQPPPTLDQIQDRLGKIRGWVCELTSVLPPHAGQAVVGGINHWNDWFLKRDSATAGEATSTNGTGPTPRSSQPIQPDDYDQIITALMVQGPVWLNLLDGQTVPVDLLSREAYEEAGEALIKRYRQLALNYLHQAWPYVTLFLFLVAVIVAAFIWLGRSKSGGAHSTSSIIGAAATLLAGLGITGKTASATVTKTANNVGASLWQSELDAAIAIAALKLPGGAPPIKPLVSRPSLLRRSGRAEKLHEDAKRLAADREERTMRTSRD